MTHFGHPTAWTSAEKPLTLGLGASWDWQCSDAGSSRLWPVRRRRGQAVARAQQPVNIIGFLGAGAATAWAPLVASFEQRLCELGWIDGHTVSIVYRWAEGKSGRFGEIATEFVRLKVDVILTVDSAVATAQWRFFERQIL